MPDENREEVKVAGDVEPFASRPTWAEINLQALAENFHAVRSRVNSNVKIMAVVKADAYGHGAVECARVLSREGAEWFGVALPEEAIELREAGIREPILCLGGFWAGQEQACLRHNLVPVVYRADMIEALDRAARDAGRVADAHLKIDTGMGRLGVRHDRVVEFLEAIRDYRNVRIDGVMTHFASADDPQQKCFTEEQLARFRDAVGVLRERGLNPTYEDCANSAATSAYPQSWGNMVRPGGVLYGLWRDILPPLDEPLRLRPVMSLHSRVMLLKWVKRGETLGYGCTFEASRDTQVATLPIGYNDGYPRALSNRGRVIVRGRYASVVGRISMDLTLIDVTDIPNVRLNDRVTLFGEENELIVPAEDIAGTAGTLSYEITCGISTRVPRFYMPA
ncbi:MAG TPA: alanine racemase [Pyrinomonadaceae bacterium]|nr:alanine racemase [Pyrinomonadaceae bacterium]